jgi:hypothetical protein
LDTKSETKIILAAGIGLFTVLGICALNRIMKTKKRKNQDIYLYRDEHRHFDISEHTEDLDGVELYALK